MRALTWRDPPLGRVNVFHPFPEVPGIVFARAAARSPLFNANPAASGDSVIIGSSAGWDPDDVRMRALGELHERVGNVLAARRAETASRVIATHRELLQAGTPALHPGSEEECPLLWVSGSRLQDGEPVLVPAGRVFVQHRPPPGCAALPSPGSVGLAARPTRPAATRHGLLEVMERDLFWRSWYSEGWRPSVLPDSGLPETLRQAIADLGLEVCLLLVEGPGDIGLAVACLHAEGRTRQSFGARAFTPGEQDMAFERAASEALMIRWSMGTPAADAAWALLRARRPPLPRNALEHALLAFHRGDSLGWLLRFGAPVRRCRPAEGGDLGAIVARHLGAEPVLVDTSVPDVCGEDAVVVRVVAPGAHRLPADERGAPPGHAGPPHPVG